MGEELYPTVVPLEDCTRQQSREQEAMNEEFYYYQFVHQGPNGQCAEKLVNVSNEKQLFENFEGVVCAAQTA